MQDQKPRQIAARALQRREAGGGFIETLLEREWAGSSLPPADRALAQELVFGTVRWQATLDWLIARKTPGKTQKPGLKVLLRLGLYQMFWLSRVPDHAAVNETVELAKQLGFGPQAGFVNAVLRGYLREREPTERALEDLRQTDPALGFSHPQWLVDRWRQRMSGEQLAALLEWNNTPPKTFARVNLLKTTPTELREQWAREKVEARLIPVDWAGDTLVFELMSFPSLATLPSFATGKFYVQDPSTLLAVNELNPQPGETILDYCAAPGGKTIFIAERMRNDGTLLAHDTSEERLQLVRENCARMGVTCAQTKSAGTLDAPPVPVFDGILVDAPCSNTGVMRRRVDLRWRITPNEIERLRAAQGRLLRDAAARLKPGGALVYSTCSLEPEENAEVIRSFLSEHPAVHFQRERALTPWEHHVDGAYVARLVKGG